MEYRTWALIVLAVAGLAGCAAPKSPPVGNSAPMVAPSAQASAPAVPSKPTVLPGKTTASSNEDGNPSENAADGDPGTRWCAVEGIVPQWWRIDFEKPVDLIGCEIHWEHDVAGYGYVVEGSKDGSDWKMLSDQTSNKFTGGTHVVTFNPADPADAQEVHSIRITVMVLPEGSWASFWEVLFVRGK